MLEKKLSDGGSAVDDVPADVAETRPAGTATPPAKATTVVMSARRPWSIGQSIGLSRGYTFEPGKAVEVTAEDARILCAREWDGRAFRRADG